MGISMIVDLSLGLKERDAVSTLSARGRRGGDSYTYTHTHTHTHTHKRSDRQGNAKWGPIQSMRHTSDPVNKEEEEAGRREGGSGSEGGR